METSTDQPFALHPFLSCCSRLQIWAALILTLPASMPPPWCLPPELPCTPSPIPEAPSALLSTLPGPGTQWPVPRHLSVKGTNGGVSGFGVGPECRPPTCWRGGVRASAGLGTPSLTLPAGPRGDAGKFQAWAPEGAAGVREPSGMEYSLPVDVEALLCSDLQSCLCPSGGCCSRTRGLELWTPRGSLMCWGGEGGVLALGWRRAKPLSSRG